MARELCRSFIIVGGAGFVGSHFTDRLLTQEKDLERVTLFDNFSFRTRMAFAITPGTRV